MNPRVYAGIVSTLEALVPAPARIEKLASGFEFTEGPIWFSESNRLLFSDIPANTIYEWRAGGEPVVFRRPSGYDGSDAPAGAFIGSNGLTRDAQGRLTICEHGNARVSRLEDDGSLTVLAARFEGKRLNSPNDLVYHSSGALYFTDPPYGMPLQDEDPKKELPFNGVYRRDRDGALHLLADNLTRPNGLAFSPDERVMYVSNSDAARKIWMRYEVSTAGALEYGEVFFDATAETADGLPDGLKVDVDGNVFATGPGGIRVFTAGGVHLGTVPVPESPANLHWGGDGRTLYITAQTSLYSLDVATEGRIP